MRTLCIEDIRENPWNVLVQPLPQHPSRHLLLVGQIAATCCRQIAEETIEELETTRSDMRSLEFHAALDEWRQAHLKIGEICYALEEKFGIPVFDFSMVRRVEKR